jgi:uncharacterized membrane protein
MAIMTEPQSWVLIGTFAAIMGAFCTIVIAMMAWQTRHFTSMLTLTKDAILGELRGELAATREELRTQLALLDRDVQAISRRIFGDEKL